MRRRASARRPSAGSPRAAELGGDAVALHADIASEDGVKSLVQAALDSFGRLDVLDNNAVLEVREDTGTATSSDKAWQQTFDITVMAAVWGARHGIPAMLASDGGGSIISISSGASRTPTATRAACGACKSALETFSLYTGAQHGASGIRSNVVRPGFVLTEGARKIFDEQQRQRFADMMTLGRVCEPEDVAEEVAYLASPGIRLPQLRDNRRRRRRSEASSLLVTARRTGLTDHSPTASLGVRVGVSRVRVA